MIKKLLTMTIFGTVVLVGVSGCSNETDKVKISTPTVTKSFTTDNTNIDRETLLKDFKRPIIFTPLLRGHP